MGRRNKNKQNQESAPMEGIEKTEAVDAANIVPEEEAVVTEETELEEIVTEVPEEEVVDEEPVKKDVSPAPKAEPKKADVIAPLKQHIALYKKILKKKVVSKADREEGISQFAKIVMYVVRNPKREVLDVVYDFFVEEKNGLMDPMVALQFGRNLTKEVAEKVRLFHVLFDHLVNKKYKKAGKAPVAMEAVRHVFGDDIVNYALSKMK